MFLPLQPRQSLFPGSEDHLAQAGSIRDEENTLETPFDELSHTMSVLSENISMADPERSSLWLDAPQLKSVISAASRFLHLYPARRLRPQQGGASLRGVEPKRHRAS